MESGLINPISIDLATLKIVLEKAGCQYSLKKMPWNRILSSIERGKLDGALNASYTEERQKYARYSQPYRQEVMGMVIRRNQINSFNPMNVAAVIQSTKSIAIHRGFYYGPEFADAYENDGAFKKRIIVSSREKPVYSWLLNGRLDLFFVNTYEAQYELKSNNLDAELAIHPFAIHSGDIHFILSKKSTTTEDIATINRALLNFQTSKTYQDFMHVLENQDSESALYKGVLKVLSERQQS